MTRWLVPLFLISASAIPAQPRLHIHIKGPASDTIFVANYDYSDQPRRLNDSTSIFTWHPALPE